MKIFKPSAFFIQILSHCLELIALDIVAFFQRSGFLAGLDEPLI